MVCGVAILVPVFTAQAQTSAFEGKLITDVQFPNGQPLDPADLERVQPLKKGLALHAEDVAHSIDRLFATGRFEDIAVEAEPSGDGVIVRFVAGMPGSSAALRCKGKVLESPNRAQLESRRAVFFGDSVS